jgi:energy-converting hydrogenase Eha subunit E
MLFRRDVDPNDPGDIIPDSYDSQPKYALTMALVCTGLIAIASLISLLGKSKRFAHVSPSLVALARYLAYKPTASGRASRATHALNLRLPALGVTLLIAAFMSAFSVWTLIVQPYYRTNISYGSPPLSLRAASLAVGLIPFVFALGSRVSLFFHLSHGLSPSQSHLSSSSHSPHRSTSSA